jgi:hypothetical protein
MEPVTPESLARFLARIGESCSQPADLDPKEPQAHFDEIRRRRGPLPDFEAEPGTVAPTARCASSARGTVHG